MKRLLAACGLCLAASCLSERPRPGPPTLSIVLDATTVRSTTPSDTVRGSIRVTDADGLDSIWMQVDAARDSADALFETLYDSRFRFAIRAGLPSGYHVPVTLEARDLVGFTSQLDTFVTVVQP